VLAKFVHIDLHDSPHIQGFTSPISSRSSHNIPSRDRIAHSQHLKQRLAAAWREADDERAVITKDRTGVYLEFRSDPGAVLVTKSLEDLRSGRVRLLNVRTETEDGRDVTYATVFVADDQRRYFLNKIEAYATQETESGNPKNANLVNSIADIRKALLVHSFWQDRIELIPSEEPEWCEVWLSSDRDEVRRRFEDLLINESIESVEGFVRFPERIVKVIYASGSDLERLTCLSDDIAEYRLAKETPAFWIELENKVQAEWVRDLIERTQIVEDTNVCVCILDTGVNNRHPLIELVLDQSDCHSIDTSWGTHDHDGHGTRMSGIAAYGDLLECLTRTGAIVVGHHLESCKILPPPPTTNPRKLWGHVTSQGVSLAEINAPERQRIFCLAVTATDTRDRGRPSSWSGQIDQLASGAEDGMWRLFVVSAGNTCPQTPMHYPQTQLENSIHDPAQAWNALTVGAYTELNEIRSHTFSGFSPLAPKGGLSPF
jgi:hypothetical protein